MTDCDAALTGPRADAGDPNRALAKLPIKLVLGAAGLVTVVALVGHYFRAELETMGHAFVERFGYAGIALGTYLADGLHCPVPPQFYMLASIVSGWSVPWTLIAVTVGSLLGGI